MNGGGKFFATVAIMIAMGGLWVLALQVHGDPPAPADPAVWRPWEHDAPAPTPDADRIVATIDDHPDEWSWDGMRFMNAYRGITLTRLPWGSYIATVGDQPIAGFWSDDQEQKPSANDVAIDQAFDAWRQQSAGARSAALAQVTNP
jgi:hypothetical protein